MLDFTKLPKKLFEVCDFRPNEDGGCTLYTYNLKPENRETIIVCRLTDFEIPHAFKVNSKAIEATKQLNDSNLVITVNETDYQAKSSKGRYKATLLGIDNFLPLNDDFTSQIITPMNCLSKACDYVAVKSNRPILRGVHVYPNGDIVASDSFRVYMYKASYDLGQGGVTLPPEFIKVAKDNFGDVENVKIDFSQINCKITKENISIYGKLYDGAFPDLNKIVNKIDSPVREINRESLESTLEYVKYIITDNKDLANYVLFADNLVKLYGQSEFETAYDIGLQFGDKVCLSAENLISAIKTFSCVCLKVQYTSEQGYKALISFENENEKVILMGIRKD